MALPKVIQSALLDFYTVAAADDNPATTMSQIYGQLDAIWDSAIKASGFNPDFACQKGCAYCCYLPVMCPPEVVFHVANEIRETWTPEDVQKIVDDISAIMGSFIVPEAIDSDDQTRDLRMRERCPFLGEDNQCRIYEVRPITCRSFTSTDVTLCQSLMKLECDLESGVGQNQLRYMLHQAATSSLALASKEKGRTFDQVFFLPAVREAILNPDLQHDWYNGKVAFGAFGN